MTPKARNTLKGIILEIIKEIDIPKSLAEFCYKSAAEKIGDKWVVYLDGIKQEGIIDLDYTGNTEYEVQEEAWAWLRSIIDECKNNNYE